MPLVSQNPATGQIYGTFSLLEERDIEQKLAQSHTAFLAWKKSAYSERKTYFLRLAEILKEKTEHYARIISEEMGKPITQAKAEIEKCAWVCEYFAKNAEKFLSPELIQALENEKVELHFDPLGSLLLVMPWNFPFWQVFRQAAPQIMAGNTIVLKHASNIPRCALAIEELFKSAGFPDGILLSLLVSSQNVERIITDKRIIGVSLTGSEKAGKEVAAAAGRCLKKVVLELGGSDPLIIFPDADIKEACHIGSLSRLSNTGQVCLASKRFIVFSDIADSCISYLIEEYKNMKIGDPLNAETQIGPISSEKALHEIEDQVSQSLSLGAECLTGGKRVGDKGYFYEPTLLKNIKKGMPAYDDEIFGPVGGLIIVENEEEALQIANDTKFGLSASIWTKDPEKAAFFARNIEAGSVFINGLVRSDPRIPLGGIKASGYGRELGTYGIREFVNIKAVVSKLE